MFDQLQKRLSSALQKVRGKSSIEAKDVDAVLGEVRTGLLEADVHFRVTKDFLARVKERCLREEVIKSLRPEEQILKVLSDELTEIFGGRERNLNLDVKAPPVAILICGLQGSGKTTSSVKLAHHLKTQGKRVALVSVDTQRPAAREQLRQLAEKADIKIFSDLETSLGAPEIARQAMAAADQENDEVLIVDTAGRLQVDESLMNELLEIQKITQAVERLLVVDSMMGQQAVEVAEGFSAQVELTGAILTKLDGDSRGGAALSFVSVTAQPIKFIGTGERFSEFEVFHPERISSRLLDQGDILSLIEKAEQTISQEEAMAAAEKLQGDGVFTIEDFRNQMKMMSKMGPLSGLMKMLPGMGGLKEQLDQVDPDAELKRVNSIIDSMTPFERKFPDQINGSRRARIARGCGMEVQEINAFIKRFLEARKMMKRMKKMGGFPGMGGGGGGNPFGGGPGGNFPKRGKGFGRKL